MSTRPPGFGLLLPVLALATAIGACCNSAGENQNENKVPPEIESIASAVTKDLTSQGCEVARGYFKLFTIEDCADAIRVMGQCYGNNPTAPYVLPIVPFWKEEYVDPTTIGGVGPTKAGTSGTFRFDPREAIIVIGRLPPPARYLGYQTYQFTREGQVDTTTDQYKFLSQYPAMFKTFFGLAPSGRLSSFASITNNINNVVIEKQSGAAFGQDRSLIVTPDQAMDRVVRASLAKAGVAANRVFTEAIPSNMKVGLDAKADDFLGIVRYAMPTDSAKADAWRKDLPMVVLRVRSKDASRPVEPYPAFEQPEARTSTDETALAVDLDALNVNVRAAWGLPPPSTPAKIEDRLLDMQRTYPIDMVGPHCIAHTMNCLGDTQDTSYMASLNLPLENETGQLLYAFVGTLATKTGNATYVSLSVNRPTVLQGVSNIEDNSLAGSQASFPQQPTKVNNTDKLYVWYFGRSCARVKTGNCTEVSESRIPKGEALKVIQRNYVRPGTQRGPNTEPAGDPKGQSPLLTAWVVAIPPATP